MYAITENSQAFFTAKINASEQKKQLLNIVDLQDFQEKSLAFMKNQSHREAVLQWELFIRHLPDFSDSKAEKMLLTRTAFRCLGNAVATGELAQFITLFRHLKGRYGLQMLHALLKADVQESERSLELYMRVTQLLIDLQGTPGIFSLVRETLPKLASLFEKLQALQEKQLAALYPERNIDSVIAGFMQQDETLPFSLEAEELAIIKVDYLGIKEHIHGLKTGSQQSLADSLRQTAMDYRQNHKANDRQKTFAILAETLRRIYKISPYDTQIIALLALVNRPEKLKGRIAQIKTGEGKSTIIAMLCAFMAAQGHYVDMVTSSGYLAIRDCEKYKPFFHALGLTVSHISHPEPRQEHFHAAILYGTNTDFEFAMLRDGLYNMKLRFSRNAEGLQERPFDVVIIDEVDNLFLDTALSAAQMGIRDYSSLSWILQPIFRIAQITRENRASEILRKEIFLQVESSKYPDLEKLSDAHLQRWFKSARTALYEKQENKDYLVRPRKTAKAGKAEDALEIVIVDYAFTGRTHEGCQWQHYIHQFLQLKHAIKLTAPAKTGASVSHPAYFNLYSWIMGLTGTMGEAIERKEIEQIYGVGSFDVPTHNPVQRKRETDAIFNNFDMLQKGIYENLLIFKNKGQPALVLFKTIRESNAFSRFLLEKNMKHQLLNETQRESEDYLVAQAGESGTITIATNTAGRGTDIILSPASREAGGLQMIFAFYPDNLRVEGQGFGRAGRQGQPGSCRMMLHTKDESIVSLMQEDPKPNALGRSSDSNFASSLSRSVNAIPGNFESDMESGYLSAANIPEFIKTLSRLRTQRIQQESLQRFECSKQEQHFFARLQEFFKKMGAVYKLAESSDFDNNLKTLCLSNCYEEQSQRYFDENHPQWIALRAMLLPLLEKQVEGISVDWTAFIIQFREVYLDEIRNCWASCYSKLKDSLEINNREEALARVEMFLGNPKGMAEALLQDIFAEGVQVLMENAGSLVPR